MTEQFEFDVFLSHSAKDKPVARELAARLKRDGVRVWFEEEQTKPSDNIFVILAETEKALENSRVLIFCMSAYALGVEWQHLEHQTLRFRDPLNKDRRFIPLRLDDTPTPNSLSQFPQIDWHTADSEQQYGKLLEACRNPASWPVVPSRPVAPNRLVVPNLESPNPAALDQARRLWGAVSALAGKRLTDEEFGVLVWDIFDIFQDESVFVFLNCWAFGADCYPTGEKFADWKGPSGLNPQLTAAEEMLLETQLSECKKAIGRIQGYLAKDLMRFSLPTVAMYLERIRSRDREGTFGAPHTLKPSSGNALLQIRLGYYRGILRTVLDGLKADEFEQLCYLLLLNDGRYAGVNYTGAAGQDRGEDIVASSGPGKRDGKWVFQCKKREKYQARHFVDDLEKLAVGAKDYDTVVFLTTKDISSSIITKVVERAKNLGFGNLEFWGATKIIAMVDAHPELLPKTFPSAATVLDDVQTRLTTLEAKTRTPETREFLRALHNEVASANQRLTGQVRGLKISVGVVAMLLLARLVYEVLAKLAQPLSKLEKDKERWREIRERTSKKVKKYRHKLKAFSDDRLQIEKSVEERFIEHALANEWGLPTDVHEVLRAELFKVSPELEAEAIADAGKYSDRRAEELWDSLLQVMKLDVVELLEEKKTAKVWSFLKHDEHSCDICGGKMSFEKTPGFITVAGNGEYVVLRATVFLCFKCERAFLLRIQESHDVEL